MSVQPRTFRAWSTPAVLVLVLALFTGCTTRTFTVDAIKNAEAPVTGPAFRIANGNPEREDSDPLVRQASGHVTTALSSKGMFQAPENVNADMVVEVDFGTEAPKKEVIRRSEPVYRKVRLPGSTYTETVTDDKGNSRTVTRHVPGPVLEELVGWRDHYYTIITYPKYLRITAREEPVEGDDRPPRELWSVYVTNNDEDRNLDTSLPLLVAAAMDSIDQNASSTQTVTLREGDERVLFIKRGM